MDKEQIISLLSAFAEQRPGLDPRNYITYGNNREGRRAYRAESRSITRDLHHARILLSAVSRAQSMTLDTLKGAFRAFAGRLTLRDDGKLDYCTGQYWPTEYRRAVCAVCAAALWDHYRDSYAAAARKGESPGDAIRRQFRREFGAHLARRWFN